MIMIIIMMIIVMDSNGVLDHHDHNLQKADDPPSQRYDCGVIFIAYKKGLIGDQKAMHWELMF